MNRIGIARALGLGLGFAVLGACSDNGPTTSPAGAGAGGAASGASGTNSAGATPGGAGAGTSGGAGGGGAAGSSGTAGSSAGSGGTASGAGGSAGTAGAGGASGSAGTAGSAGAATCTPATAPSDGKMYPTSGWSAQWNVPCDFTTNGGCNGVLPPERAFDGLGNTRTSIGDTHIKAGGKFAQVIGDAFTFDMKGCQRVGRMVMFAAAPPGNMGSFDARDFPGTVQVKVSSDCQTSAQGVISGTFGDVVATANEPKPGCQSDCDKPLTITIDPPVPAKCVKLELTHVLQIGGGVWWAIDELQVYASP